jgi:hypothetical protein
MSCCLLLLYGPFADCAHFDAKLAKTYEIGLVSQIVPYFAL